MIRFLKQKIKLNNLIEQINGLDDEHIDSMHPEFVKGWYQHKNEVVEVIKNVEGVTDDD